MTHQIVPASEIRLIDFHNRKLCMLRNEMLRDYRDLAHETLEADVSFRVLARYLRDVEHNWGDQEAFYVNAKADDILRDFESWKRLEA